MDSKIISLVIIFFFLFFTACIIENKNDDSPSFFFDLKAYFNQQKIALKQVKQFEKTIYLDDKKEEKKLSNLDVETALTLFSNSDINKSAWQDKYQVDSIMQNNLLSALQYNALDNNLKTKQLSIFFTNEKIDSIIILNKANNIVVMSDQKLKYIPDRGYQIISKQRVTSQSEHALIVDVKFVY